MSSDEREERRKKDFEEHLNQYSKIDIVKVFRDKIFETEIGCWKRVTKNDKYPLKIFKDVEDSLPEFKDVKYYINGNVFKKIPPKEDLLAASSRLPNIRFIVDDIITYDYIFPVSVRDDQKEWYPILYSFFVNLRNLGKI